jgi:hypothetical protein
MNLAAPAVEAWVSKSVEPQRSQGQAAEIAKKGCTGKEYRCQFFFASSALFRRDLSGQRLFGKAVLT